MVNGIDAETVPTTRKTDFRDFPLLRNSSRPLVIMIHRFFISLLIVNIPTEQMMSRLAALSASRFTNTKRYNGTRLQRALDGELLLFV